MNSSSLFSASSTIIIIILVWNYNINPLDGIKSNSLYHVRWFYINLWIASNIWAFSSGIISRSYNTILAHDELTTLTLLQWNENKFYRKIKESIGYFPYFQAIYYIVIVKRIKELTSNIYIFKIIYWYYLPSTNNPMWNNHLVVPLVDFRVLGFSGLEI